MLKLQDSQSGNPVALTLFINYLQNIFKFTVKF